MDVNFTILIVEDDKNDVIILKSALQRAGIKNPVKVVNNGQEAINYLRGDGEFADRNNFPFPKVIFSDLKMPVMDGFQVLEWLRGHPDCSVIPFIVLSASKLNDDVRRAYQMGANAYLTKPTSLSVLEEMVKTAFEFWQWCQIPQVPEKC